MKKTVYAFLLIIIFASCRKNNFSKSNTNHILVKKCESFVGTPYQFGGTTKKGLDCSGLIYVAFQEVGKEIPRVSYKQAEFFDEIPKTDIQIGDLVYFKVNSGKINHTGIVSRIEKRDEIYFLHASTSAGVREDNLFSNYWIPKFVKVTRPQI